MRNFLRIKLIVILLIIVCFPILSFSQSSKQSSINQKQGLTNYNFQKWRLQENTQPKEKTPLHFDAIAVEAVGGILSGFALGAILQGIINYDEFFVVSVYGNNDELSLKDDLEIFYPLYTGIIFGSALFVNYIGDRRGDNGSFWAALSGSAISFLISFRINETLKFTAPSIGATIAYNLTRNPVSKTSSNSSFVNIKDGDFNLSIPQISLKYDYSYGGSGLIQSVNLMRISF